MVTSDAKFIKEIQKLPCLACGRPEPSEAAHVKARSMGGAYGDDWWNLISLCSWCHTDAPWSWHSNFTWFINKHPHVKTHLEKLGWEFWILNKVWKFAHPKYRDRRVGEK